MEALRDADANHDEQLARSNARRRMERLERRIEREME